MGFPYDSGQGAHQGVCTLGLGDFIEIQLIVYKFIVNLNFSVNYIKTFILSFGTRH